MGKRENSHNKSFGNKHHENIVRDKHKTSAKSSSGDRKPKKFNSSKAGRVNVIKRRNTNNKRDYSTKPKTLKHSKMQEKAEAKINSKKTNIKEVEDQILYIEHDNKLFNRDNFYFVQKDQELVKDNDLKEWELENKENNEISNVENEDKEEKMVSLHDMLMGKMNQVEDNELDPEVVESFKSLGKILNEWTSGKLPKLFGILPGLDQWREYIVFTEPHRWTPHAMYEGVFMFASNLNNTLVEIFYRDFFVPYLRQNIKIHGKLNIHLYNGLKKALFKPAGFFKGIIFPLAENLNAKEANIFGSILRKCSIPLTHSASAIKKLFDNNGYNRISHGHFFFIKLLLSKKYALPTDLKSYIVKFIVDITKNKLWYNKVLPIIFHQVLLVFVQIYKFNLLDEEKSSIRELCKRFNHHMITELILKEVNFKNSDK